MAAPSIILTTDFGPASVYVGVMKGVILSINPSATIVDLTHQIQPQNVSQAAFLLGTSHRFFPNGSIHVVVVDPGVGTERRAVVLVTPTARFLAPDNGVLSMIVRQLWQPPNQKSPPPPFDKGGREGISDKGGQGGISASAESHAESRRVPVPPGCAAYQLTNPQYWLHPVSHTFHGRDIFAPVAAHLSRGVPAEAVGQRVMEMVWLSMAEPTCQGNTIQGRVVVVDHFGNLITNIPEGWLAGADALRVEVKGQRITRLSRTFHDEAQNDPPTVAPYEKGTTGGLIAGHLLALIGSHGYLEIALRDGSATAMLEAGPGEAVYVISPPLEIPKES